MKKLTAVLLTAIVVMSALSGCFSATAAKSKTVKSGSWKYTVSKNTAEICKYTGREKSVTIPEKLGGKRVVSVGKRAFFRNDTITSVRIPKTIRTIGKSAFEGCKSLGKITFAIGLRTIGQEAFYECTSLTSVKLPDTVTELEKSAFCWCEKLRTLKLSKNIRVINAHTFNSTLITKVTVPENCVEIGKNAFTLSDVKTVTIGAKVKRISSGAFDAAKKLKAISVSKDNKYFSANSGILYNKTKTELLAYPVAKDGTEFTVPAKVETIGGSAFSSSPLRKITLPVGLKTIGAFAFNSSQKLVRADIPKTVTTIGKFAFNECYKLRSVSIPSSVRVIGSSAFASSGIRTLSVNHNKSLTLRDGVFSFCNELGKVTLFPVKSSDGNTFESCGSLTEVIIPETVGKVYKKDFFGCESLKSVTIPETVTEIGSKAFGITIDAEQEFYKEILIKGFKMSGKSGSAAEKYAKQNKIPFTAK